VGDAERVCFVSSGSLGAFVQAAGIRVRLLSGKIRTRYRIPFRRIWPKTFRSWPCRGGGAKDGDSLGCLDVGSVA